MGNRFTLIEPLAVAARPLASTAFAVLGRAIVTAALQVLVLLAGTAVVLVALFGALWLSG